MGDLSQVVERGAEEAAVGDITLKVMETIATLALFVGAANNHGTPRVIKSELLSCVEKRLKKVYGWGAKEYISKIPEAYKQLVKDGALAEESIGVKFNPEGGTKYVSWSK